MRPSKGPKRARQLSLRALVHMRPWLLEGYTLVALTRMNELVWLVSPDPAQTRKTCH
ncbi:hypothetical protein HanRHA438_Chr15g0702341 [Helianthus annuus]|nr:hypothetical protein HanRHA438_Chr15g0702341 [Helianthus annuus]